MMVCVLDGEAAFLCSSHHIERADNWWRGRIGRNDRRFFELALRAKPRETPCFFGLSRACPGPLRVLQTHSQQLVQWRTIECRTSLVSAGACPDWDSRTQPLKWCSMKQRSWWGAASSSMRQGCQPSIHSRPRGGRATPMLFSAIILCWGWQMVCRLLRKTVSARGE